MSYGYRTNRHQLRTGVVYTDGACLRNGQPGATAGYGFYWPKSGERDYGRVCGSQTNNRAELAGVLRALEWDLDRDVPFEKVIIRTDSDLLIKTMTCYIEKWKRNGWRTTKGTPVKNRDIIEEIEKAIERYDQVVFEHVAAHTGIAGNERADLLANKGARM